MKTTDEHGTIIYFTIPHNAVTIVSENEIVINIINNTNIPMGVITELISSIKPFMRFSKASSTKYRTSSYYPLKDEEFALLQKEVEQYFAQLEYSKIEELLCNQ